MLAPSDVRHQASDVGVTGEGATTTRLQEAAYGAQFAAALSVSDSARAVLVADGGRIGYQCCATYIHATQRAEWFASAFPAHTRPVTVLGGAGVSRADAVQRWVKIGTADRFDVARCELACLHELAHIVTCDFTPAGERREPAIGPASSKGHHHAWRVNFVFIVKKTLGKPSALRLRHEFEAWGLPTHK